jgi:DNA invertase Pin-like site-specific DNA recombinase
MKETKTKAGSKAVAAYIRVSTVGQNEASQREEISRWLAGSGLAGNVRWFVDKKSGETLDRPALNELRAAIFRGEVGCVAVFKLDRLSRSLAEGVNLISDWCKRNVRLVAVSGGLDISGPCGKLVATVLLNLAEMETEIRRERQAAGIAVAKKAGKYKGRLRGTTKADPARALALKKKGLTAAEIGKSLGVSRVVVFRYLKAAAASV